MKETKYAYTSVGSGDTLILLHGLFGSLSNWENVLKAFSQKYKIILPELPIYRGKTEYLSVSGLVHYLEEFTQYHNLHKITLMGNSLGGHIALLYTLNNPLNVHKMILTGSSGLFENMMGSSYPHRGNYEFMKEKIGYIFYNPKTATNTLIKEVFKIISNHAMCLRTVGIAKSAQRNNLSQYLYKIKTPTLLIWGLNDTVTPPSVAHEFRYKLQNAELHFIDKCSHVPMMEHPILYNTIVENFLSEKKAEPIQL